MNVDEDDANTTHWTWNNHNRLQLVDMPLEGYIVGLHCYKRLAGARPKWNNCWWCSRAYSEKGILFWHQITKFLGNVFFAEDIRAKKKFHKFVTWVRNRCSFMPFFTVYFNGSIIWWCAPVLDVSGLGLIYSLKNLTVLTHL